MPTVDGLSPVRGNVEEKFQSVIIRQIISPNFRTQ